MKAYNDLCRRVAKIVTPQLKIAELQRGIAQFEGTPYKKLIESTILREKNKLLRDMLSKIISTAQRIRDPEAKAAFLRTNRPKFADTRYGRIIDLMIKRVEAERVIQLAPAEDEDDVF